MRNERGSALVLVLLVTVIFTILGLSLMTQVINENKLSAQSEKEMQARNLAESGLVYFEQDIERFILEEENRTEDELNEFINNYNSKDVIGNNGSLEQAKITEVSRNPETGNIEVHTLGKTRGVETELLKSYELAIKSIEIESKTEDIATFDRSSTKAYNFSDVSVIDTQLLGLVNLGVLKGSGNDKKFYGIPDEAAIGLNVLGGLIGVNIGSNRFKTVEENQVVAVREGALLDLFVGKNLGPKPISINLLNYQSVENTNVLIDGYFKGIRILWFINLADGYQNIDFKKIAVLGNANIKQQYEDKENPRYFSFREGLYINQSLILGDPKTKGNVGLVGDIVVMKDLSILNVDLQIGKQNNSKYNKENILNLYVHGNVEISDSCIHLQDPSYDVRILTHGKITFKNNSNCNEFPGYYYAEGGIEFITNNQNMRIKGKVFADDINIDYPNKLDITEGTFNINQVSEGEDGSVIGIKHLEREMKP